MCFSCDINLTLGDKEHEKNHLFGNDLPVFNPMGMQ